VKKMATKLNETESEFKDKLVSSMEGVFDIVINERKKHYKTNPKPSKFDANKIIYHYSNLNAGISGALNLVPGPFGLVAIVPELILIVKYQLMMVCDIGYAYGDEKGISKETLLYVFGNALGMGGMGLGIIQGNKILIKRVSLRIFQKIIAWLGGKITQRALKALIAKWFPLAGATAMAAWSHYSTKTIGNKSVELFSKFDFELSDATEDDIIEAKIIKEIQPDKQLPEEIISIKLLHIKALVNLMKADNVIKGVEKEFIMDAINVAGLNEEDRAEIMTKFDTPPPDKFEIDFTPFKTKPAVAVDLLINLVALAKRDKEFHISEKMYVKQVGRILGFSEEEINELMEEGPAQQDVEN